MERTPADHPGGSTMISAKVKEHEPTEGNVQSQEPTAALAAQASHSMIILCSFQLLQLDLLIGH